MKVTQYSQYILAHGLIFSIASIVSCANQSYSNQETRSIQVQVSDNAQSDKENIKTDTTLRLKFTTGVRSILEDSKGNVWFGDRDSGAWKYDGKSLKNYSAKDGLTTTHIWQIYRSKKGELWFAMDDGSVRKFNGESFDRIF